MDALKSCMPVKEMPFSLLESPSSSLRFQMACRRSLSSVTAFGCSNYRVFDKESIRLLPIVWRTRAISNHSSFLRRDSGPQLHDGRSHNSRGSWTTCSATTSSQGVSAHKVTLCLGLFILCKIVRNLEISTLRLNCIIPILPADVFFLF